MRHRDVQMSRQTYKPTNIQTETKMASFYDYIDRDMDGNDVPMSEFSGEVLLLVNVASY